MLFSLRRRYIHQDNEFWRENLEAQGLQILQWSVDEVCQLLIHMGLDKYIPEFSVNQITGPRFLDLDGNKLKVINLKSPLIVNMFIQSMGIQNHSDRSIIKKKVKSLKARIESERKLLVGNNYCLINAINQPGKTGSSECTEAEDADLALRSSMSQTKKRL